MTRAAAIGYTLRPEDARNYARWAHHSPEAWSELMAWNLREGWLERRGGPFPYWLGVVARAIELSMREDKGDGS